MIYSRATDSISPVSQPPISQDLYIPTIPVMDMTRSADPYSSMDIVWPNWPSNLPGSELLRHL